MDDFKILKKEFPDKWNIRNQKLGYPYKKFNSNDVYQELVDGLKKEDFFSKIKNKGPDDIEIERTKQTIKIFNIKNGEELTRLYMKTDIILLAGVFEKFIKVSTKEFGGNSLQCVSICSYTLPCWLKYTEFKLESLQDKDMILLIENKIRGGISYKMNMFFKIKKFIIYRCYYFIWTLDLSTNTV